MASAPMTLRQIRERVLQRLGIGGLNAEGYESDLNRPIPLPQFNYEVNTALQSIVDDVTLQTGYKGIRPFGVTWPANAVELTLGQLGVTNSRIDSIYLLDDQGSIVQRLRPAADDQTTIASGTGWRQNVSPYVNAGFMGYYSYAWSFAPPDKLRIGPPPGAPVNLQIRVYATDGFINLTEDDETVPVEWFYHRCIEDLLVATVCSRVDPQLQRRPIWANDAKQVKANNIRVFTPQRPVEITFGGV